MDSEKAQVTVLILMDGLYEEVVVKGTEKIQSQVFPALELMVEQVLQAGQ